MSIIGVRTKIDSAVQVIIYLVILIACAVIFFPSFCKFFGNRCVCVYYTTIHHIDMCMCPVIII